MDELKPVFTIGDIIATLGNNTTQRSERAEIIKELYEMYEADNKKQNWLSYRKTLREKELKDSNEERTKFKKTKLYFKTKSVKSFCFFISHIPTKDLYYLSSEAKDRANRKQSFVKWLFWSIKATK